MVLPLKVILTQPWLHLPLFKKGPSFIWNELKGNGPNFLWGSGNSKKGNFSKWKIMAKTHIYWVKMGINYSRKKVGKVAKIEKPPFLEPQNMKSSQVKFQKSVDMKSGQLLSRDRSTQKQISQTTPQLTTKTKPGSHCTVGLLLRSTLRKIIK